MDEPDRKSIKLVIITKCKTTPNKSDTFIFVRNARG